MSKTKERGIASSLIQGKGERKEGKVERGGGGGKRREGKVRREAHIILAQRDEALWLLVLLSHKD